MSHTSRQMLDLATRFFDPKTMIEIIAVRGSNNRKEFVLTISDSEVLTADMDVIPVDSPRLAPSNCRFSSVEKAFAVLDVYAANMKKT